MKTSLTNLEIARKDINAFAACFSEKGPQFNNSPKTMRWLNALNTYHKTDSKSEAVNYLLNAFSNRAQTKNNIEEAELFVTTLLNCITEIESKGLIYNKVMGKIIISIAKDQFITGKIWTIYQNSSGMFYSYIVTNDLIHAWSIELRFPIIQKYIAEKILIIDANRVEVGIIDIQDGKPRSKNFSDEEIEIAYKELDEIIIKVNEVLEI